MSKENSIDWLISELKTELGYGIDLGKSDQRKLDNIIKDAKQRHKEEIIQVCYIQIQNIDVVLSELIYKKGPEEIYNETFNKENQ